VNPQARDQGPSPSPASPDVQAPRPIGAPALNARSRLKPTGQHRRLCDTLREKQQQLSDQSPPCCLRAARPVPQASVPPTPLPSLAAACASGRQRPSMASVPELVHVTSVEVVGDHQLRLAFEDGTEGEIDFSAWDWRGVFEPLLIRPTSARSSWTRNSARSCGRTARTSLPRRFMRGCAAAASPKPHSAAPQLAISHSWISWREVAGSKPAAPIALHEAVSLRTPRRRAPDAPPSAGRPLRRRAPER
jgi:hypothetical protein